MTRRSPASDAATALLGALVREGVRDVVVAPGSRSQALALAAAELERVGAIRLHVRIDERGAGFLALGTAVESGRPLILVMDPGPDRAPPDVRVSRRRTSGTSRNAPAAK